MKDWILNIFLVIRTSTFEVVLIGLPEFAI